MRHDSMARIAARRCTRDRARKLGSFAGCAVSLALALTAAPLGAQTPCPASHDLNSIDQVVDAGISAKKLPGAVVVVGHDGQIVFHRAYGMRSLEAVREPMTEDTVFDMASMTKVLVTAPAVMQLYEQGRLRLDDPVAKYLPEFAANGKRAITIRQLLTHTSGLAPDLPLADPWSGKQEGKRRTVRKTGR